MSGTGNARPELDNATHNAAAATRNRDVIDTVQAPKAPHERSRGDCLTCRRRRIRCGLERPACSNCIRAKRACEGYARPLTFRHLTDAGRWQVPRKHAKIESPNAPIQPPLSSDDSRFFPQPWVWEDPYFPINAPPRVPQYLNDWAQAKPAVGSEIHPTKPPSPMGSRQYRSSSESELSFVNEHDLHRRGEEGPDETTQKFIKELAERLVQRYSLAAKALTERPSNPSQTKSASLVLGSTLEPKQATRGSSSRKRSSRSLDDGDDPDDDDDDDERATDPKRHREGKEQSTKLFACPYAKFNPGRYSEQNTEERNYRGCASKYLRNIPRVKQHLYRVHARPHWYCGNCYLEFRSREQLNSHIRTRPPCEAAPPKYEEMMTDAQYALIKRRDVGATPRDAWFLIFSILFPEASPPLSPYVSTSHPETLQHFVNFFRAHGPEEMMGLMRESHERNGAPITLNVSTQAVVDEAFEIAVSESLPPTWQPQASATLAENTDESAETATGIEPAAVVPPHSPLLSSSLEDSWEMVVNPGSTWGPLTSSLPPTVPSEPVSDPNLVSLQQENQEMVYLDILEAFGPYLPSGSMQGQGFWFA